MSSSVGVHHEEIEKKVRNDVRRGKWAEVFRTYIQERELRTAKITATGNTVLHMAVSNGQDKVAADMVDYLVLEESWNVDIVLGAENDRKNTPLHLAAIMGNVNMCKKIGHANPSFISKRNIVGETPLFLAAVHGKKEAFLWLHYLYMTSHKASSIDFAHCVRDNGDTILHCAIAKGHFDVAIEIVHLYQDRLRDMTIMRNKNGLSPFHLLAAERSAFKSTGLLELSIFGHPIYWILRVKEKKQATTREELEQRKCKAWIIEALCCAWYMFIGRWVHQVWKMKEKHTWSLQIMNELLQHASEEDMSQMISRTASEQLSLQTEEDKDWIESESMATPLPGTVTIETPLMIAAKNGVVEMVDKILELFPFTIKDVNAEGKNIVVLAAEYKQTDVFKFLCKQESLSESVFRRADKEGNNALHLAARLGVEPDWLSPGETIPSMPREFKWFEFVKMSVPDDLRERYNRKMETPDDIFKESHKELMKSEGEWAAKTSQACFVVSTLVMSVAFATCTSVPGGYDGNGYAILINKSHVFKYFVGYSSMAFSFSLVSTIFFLSIAASPSQSVRSWRYVPFKLYCGMAFMFTSILFLWISFCIGDVFMLDNHKKQLAIEHDSKYIILSSMIILLLAIQLPTFFGPISSTFRLIPKRKPTRPIEYRQDRR